MPEEVDVYGMTEAERTKMHAAALIDDERGALAMAALQWPPHPIRSSWILSSRNISHGEGRVHRAAFRLFKIRHDEQRRAQAKVIHDRESEIATISSLLRRALLFIPSTSGVTEHGKRARALALEIDTVLMALKGRTE